MPGPKACGRASIAANSPLQAVGEALEAPWTLAMTHIIPIPCPVGTPSEHVEASGRLRPRRLGSSGHPLNAFPRTHAAAIVAEGVPQWIVRKGCTMPTDAELVDLEARREELRNKYLAPTAERPQTPGRGIHHLALICSDVEQTIQFYQGLLGFPLVELVENRDYNGSTHFFFDLGNQTLLGFFDFPGLGLEQGVESIGAVQHIAIGVPPD